MMMASSKAYRGYFTFYTSITSSLSFPVALEEHGSREKATERKRLNRVIRKTNLAKRFYKTGGMNDSYKFIFFQIGQIFVPGDNAIGVSGDGT
jgi:hypothetical protein